MKKILLLASVMLSTMAFAQGHETFDNLDTEGNSYLNGSFVGQDGIEWTYGQSRGDIELNGKALTIGRNRAEDMFLESAALTNGVGTLEFSYSQAFSNPVNLEVLVNGILVYTATSDDEQGVIKSSGVITVEAEAGAVIKFNNPDGAQVTLDDIIWTAFDGNGGGGGDDYCTVSANCADGDLITNVTFMEIDNTTDCSPNGYGDYTDMFATVAAGESYPISVAVGDGWYERVSMWIDWGQDGSFDQEDYMGEIADGGQGIILEDVIDIPVGVADGDYRIRLYLGATGSDEPAPSDPCLNDPAYYGEIEDYTLRVDNSIVGIEDNSLVGFSYFPNPTNDVLNLNANIAIEGVEAFNLLGQKVINDNDFNNGQVNVSTLPVGSYIFKVQFENGTQESFNVIKQ